MHQKVADKSISGWKKTKVSSFDVERKQVMGSMASANGLSSGKHAMNGCDGASHPTQLSLSVWILLAKVFLK